MPNFAATLAEKFSRYSSTTTVVPFVPDDAEPSGAVPARRGGGRGDETGPCRGPDEGASSSPRGHRPGTAAAATVIPGPARPAEAGLVAVRCARRGLNPGLGWSVKTQYGPSIVRPPKRKGFWRPRPAKVRPVQVEWSGPAKPARPGIPTAGGLGGAGRGQPPTGPAGRDAAAFRQLRKRFGWLGSAGKTADRTSSGCSHANGGDASTSALPKGRQNRLGNNNTGRPWTARMRNLLRRGHRPETTAVVRLRGSVVGKQSDQGYQSQCKGGPGKKTKDSRAPGRKGTPTLIVRHHQRVDFVDPTGPKPVLSAGDPLPIPGVPQRDSVAGVRPTTPAEARPTKGSLASPLGKAGREVLHLSIPVATWGQSPVNTTTPSSISTKSRVTVTSPSSPGPTSGSGPLARKSPAVPCHSLPASSKVSGTLPPPPPPTPSPKLPPQPSQGPVATPSRVTRSPGSEGSVTAVQGSGAAGTGYTTHSVAAPSCLTTMTRTASYPSLDAGDIEYVLSGQTGKKTVLGRGEYGQVLLARHHRDGRLLAVKRLISHRGLACSTAAAAAAARTPDKGMLREVRAMRAVAGCRFFAELVGVIDGRSFAQEFVGDGGGSSADFWTALGGSRPGAVARAPPIRLTPLEWLHACRDVTRGLMALHGAGWVHCDLHSCNAMVCRNPPGSEVGWTGKIIDLGCAYPLRKLPPILKLTKEEKETYYKNCAQIAPEIVEGKSQFNVQADVFSLGRLFADVSRADAALYGLHRVGMTCLRSHAPSRPKLGVVLIGMDVLCSKLAPPKQPRPAPAPP